MVLLGKPPPPYQLGWLHCSFGSGNILLPTLATPVPGSLARPSAVQPPYTGPTYPLPTRLLSARRAQAHSLKYPWEPHPTGTHSSGPTSMMASWLWWQGRGGS